MRLLSGFLLTLLIGTSCAELSPRPEERYARDVQALREWLRGPMMRTCSSLPGPESRRGCAMGLSGAIANLRGDHITRDDHFRIELAKAKAADETRQLWSRTEQEAWLRGPKTRSCKQAPLAAFAEGCLKTVQDDVAALTRPDTLDDDQPVVRAERAVARIEARERERAVDRQRGQATELVQQQAEEPTLMVLGVGGGLFGTSTATFPAQYVHQPVPQMPLTSLLPSPPVSCTSQHVGQIVYTNCY